MWRKLTSLLFEEEEIILEEEELQPRKEAKETKIEPIKPLKDKKLVEDTSDTIEIDAIDETFVETHLETEKPKKSVMIDLEEDKESKVKEHIPRIFDTTKAKEEYKKRSILSPMHGGDDTDESPQTIKDTQVKKHKPVTQVISPMYGSIHEEESEEEVFEDKLMDIDLKGMIYEEENDDEVQTSLYDFLEGLEQENE